MIRLALLTAGALVEETTLAKHPKDWAARKTDAVTQPPTEAEAARIAVLDAARAAFKVSVAGVDVTRWRPALPPELRGKKR